MGGKSSSSAETKNSVQDNRFAATEGSIALRAGDANGNNSNVSSKFSVTMTDKIALAVAAVAAQENAKTARAAIAAQTMAVQEVRALAGQSLDFGGKTLVEAFDFANETQDEMFSFLRSKDAQTLDLVSSVVDSTQANTQNAINKLISAERDQSIETFQMLLKLLAAVAVVYFAAKYFGKGK